ncbi:MAG: class I SAM-dependent methyltransferase [Pyrinomonadaceae bacterium]
MSWQDEYLSRFYPPNSKWVDGTTEFHQLCAAAIMPGGRVLEVGAGPSNETSDYLASLGRLEGLDINQAVNDNRALAAAHLLYGRRYPLPDNSFDACVSNYVLEHVADGFWHLSEIYRVLKPGGVYVFRTPNQYHYVSAVSRFTPFWFHKLVANRLRALPSDSHDPYPTYYKLNSVRVIRKHSGQVNFQVEELRLIEKEPMYGLSARALFLTFMAYERVVNRFDRLAFLRANILGVLRKPDAI